jgi:hypothetical protein
MPIGQVSFNLQKSLFLKELNKRARDFSARRTIAYRIRVPEDLKFWYWLEFGTAGRQDADAPFKTAHSGTYPIDPVHAGALSWGDATHPNDGNGGRFQMHVDHPGIRPRLIYRGVRDDILFFARSVLSKSLSMGIEVASLKSALRTVVMPYAVAQMGKRLDEQAPGVKARGNNPFTKGTSKVRKP